MPQRLKILRERYGFTQEQAADKLNITPGTLSGYERGYRRPDTDMLVKLANLYKTTTDYILGRTDSILPSKPEFDPDAPLREKSLADALLKVSEMAYQFDLDDETASLLIKKAFDRFGPPKPIIKEGEAASGPRYPGTGALDKHKKKEDD